MARMTNYAPQHDICWVWRRDTGSGISGSFRRHSTCCPGNQEARNYIRMFPLCEEHLISLRLILVLRYAHLQTVEVARKP